MKNLPTEAKKLLKREATNLIEMRKKLRMFLQGTIAGGALQIFRAKRELEEYFAKELLDQKAATRKERIKDISKEIGSKVYVPNATEVDIYSAHFVASSFSSAWASSQMANTPFNWDPRLRRIVATETARSFSDVVQEAAAKLNISRKWVSVLDAKTCPFCKSMDGEETQPGETFAGGQEPGWAHVNCRCYSILVIK